MKKYYIGDLGSLFDEKEWKIFLDQTELLQKNVEFSFGEYKGFTFHWGTTADGDGTYKDNFGRSYDVDAGLIGIVSADFPASSDVWKASGQIVELKGKPRIRIGNGIFQFGDVVIDTRSWEDEEDDEGEEISTQEKNIELNLNGDEAKILTKFLGCLKTSDVEKVMHNKVESDYNVETIAEALGVIYMRLEQSIDPLI
jgi:hypothetical protein